MNAVMSYVELLAAHAEDRLDLEARAHSGLWPS